MSGPAPRFKGLACGRRRVVTRSCSVCKKCKVKCDAPAPCSRCLRYNEKCTRVTWVTDGGQKTESAMCDWRDLVAINGIDTQLLSDVQAAATEVMVRRVYWVFHDSTLTPGKALRNISIIQYRGSISGLLSHSHSTARGHQLLFPGLLEGLDRCCGFEPLKGPQSWYTRSGVPVGPYLYRVMEQVRKNEPGLAAAVWPVWGDMCVFNDPFISTFCDASFLQQIMSRTGTSVSYLINMLFHYTDQDEFACALAEVLFSPADVSKRILKVVDKSGTCFLCITRLRLIDATDTDMPLVLLTLELAPNSRHIDSGQPSTRLVKLGPAEGLYGPVARPPEILQDQRPTVLPGVQVGLDIEPVAQPRPVLPNNDVRQMWFDTPVVKQEVDVGRYTHGAHINNGENDVIGHAGDTSFELHIPLLPLDQDPHVHNPRALPSMTPAPPSLYSTSARMITPDSSIHRAQSYIPASVYYHDGGISLSLTATAVVDATNSGFHSAAHPAPPPPPLEPGWSHGGYYQDPLQFFNDMLNDEEDGNNAPSLSFTSPSGGGGKVDPNDDNDGMPIANIEDDCVEILKKLF